MKYEDYLKRIIDDGIEAAKRDYADKPLKLEGAVAGFEACRGKSPEELCKLLDEAGEKRREASLKKAADYWRHRFYEAEIEWVCNCVAALQDLRKEPAIVRPTMRGYLKMSEVVGIRPRA
jgi:hypothetical protein